MPSMIDDGPRTSPGGVLFLRVASSRRCGVAASRVAVSG
jgi:hypothetical protein